MEIYLLCLIPVLLVAPWGHQLGFGRILFIWIATTGISSALMGLGSRDLPVYLEDFSYKSAAWSSDLSWQDPLYLGAMRLWALAGGSGFAFYITLSSLALLLKLTAFPKLTRYSSLAALLYLSSYFYLHEFTQIRAALAIGIWMHAIAGFEKSKKRYILLTLLASTIHIQAILGFALLPLAYLIRSTKGRQFVVFSVLIIMLLAPTRIFDQLGFAVIGSVPDPRAAIYISFAEQEAWVRPNPFSIISLMAFVTGAAGLLRIAPFDAAVPSQEQSLVYAAILAGSASLSLFAAITVGAFRVSEHFFALLPVAIANLTYQSRSRSIMLVPMVMAAGLLAYVFLFHSPTLVDPVSGVPNE